MTSVSEPPPTRNQTSSGAEGSTLVAEPDEVMAHLSASRARSVIIAIMVVMVFGGSMIPKNPHTLWRVLGGLSLVTIVAVALLARHIILSDPLSSSRQRKANAIALVGFFASAPLPFFFGPYGNMAAAGSVLLILYSLRASNRFSIVAAVLVAVPHLVAIALNITGVLTATGVHVMERNVGGEIVAGVQSLALYALGTWVGIQIRTRSGSSLVAIQSRFRRVAEREALLREARAELERAAAAGLEGRLSGETLGSFHLGPLLGRGGMGEIYEARHVSTHLEAAVKVPRVRGGSSGNVMENFAREGRILSSIDSPHVIRVLEVGAGDEHALPFLAMERIRGHDLGHLLRDKLRLSVDETLALALQIADGLDSAHATGVVHCDIKPDNLLLTRDGTWKILDFGVAHDMNETVAKDREGIAGTPAFMAPEQLDEEALVDERADVYALGVVLYRALTGQPAFSGRDARATMQRVRRSLPEAPSTVLPSVGDATDAVFRVALAKRPQDRFGTARELAAALSASLRGQPDADIVARAQRLNQQLGWRSAA